jgi:hypothetical protein
MYLVMQTAAAAAGTNWVVQPGTMSRCLQLLHTLPAPAHTVKPS